MLRRSEEDVPHLGLDEKSSERGHTYVSILTDIDHSRVLDLIPEQKLEAAKSLLGTLSQTQRASVKAVAIDMWPAFMSAAQTCLPKPTSSMTGFTFQVPWRSGRCGAQARTPQLSSGRWQAADR